MVRKVPIVAVIATLATTVAAIFAYTCYADNEKKKREDQGKGGSKKDAGAIGSSTDSTCGRDEVLHVLKLVQNSQVESKQILTKLTDDIMAVPRSFLEVYEIVQKSLPKDPLVECGMSVEAFDQILNAYQDDAEVKLLIDSIMAVEAQGSSTDNVNDLLDVPMIIKIHSFMLEELVKIVEVYKNIPDRSSFDSRSLTMASQALIGSKVKQEFKVNPDQVEAGVLHNYTHLQYDHVFNTTVVKMQAVMGELMSGGEGM